MRSQSYVRNLFYYTFSIQTASKIINKMPSSIRLQHSRGNCKQTPDAVRIFLPYLKASFKHSKKIEIKVQG